LLKASISSPFPASSQQGNSVSARRIGRLLENSGHTVNIYQDGYAQDAEVLIVLNAWRSAKVIKDFASEAIQQGTVGDSIGYDRRRLIVVMTGSDLFPLDGIIKPETLESVRLADAVVVTHSLGREKIDHPMLCEIRKSLVLPEAFSNDEDQNESKGHSFTGVMVAHLREQKNPFLYLRAIPFLKERVRVDHYGNATADFHDDAIRYKNEFYQWCGVIPRLEMLTKV